VTSLVLEDAAERTRSAPWPTPPETSAFREDEPPLVPKTPSSPILVLDVGGVVLEDPVPALLDALAALSRRRRRAIIEYYTSELRTQLWSGAASEPEFWDRLLHHCGLPPDPALWRASLLAAMLPLPAAAHLASWSQSCTLWGLTNHRAEWVRPRLRDEHLADIFERLQISSETGLVKPAPEAFAPLVAAAVGRRVLFVDDKPRNVAAATAAGLPALLADPASDWVVAVNYWVRAVRD